MATRSDALTIDVYCHTHRESGRRYVGYASNGMMCRWRDHVRNAIHENRKCELSRAIREHGPEAFNHEVICTAQTLKDAKFLERHYIEMLNTWGPLGYNMNRGGGGGSFLGKKLSRETLEKIKAKLRNQTPEMKKRRGDAMRGKRRGPQKAEMVRKRVEKIRNFWSTRSMSIESIDKRNNSRAINRLVAALDKECEDFQ